MVDVDADAQDRDDLGWLVKHCDSFAASEAGSGSGAIDGSSMSVNLSQQAFMMEWGYDRDKHEGTDAQGTKSPHRGHEKGLCYPPQASGALDPCTPADECPFGPRAVRSESGLDSSITLSPDCSTTASSAPTTINAKVHEDDVFKCTAHDLATARQKTHVAARSLLSRKAFDDEPHPWSLLKQRVSATASDVALPGPGVAAHHRFTDEELKRLDAETSNAEHIVAVLKARSPSSLSAEEEQLLRKHTRVIRKRESAQLSRGRKKNRLENAELLVRQLVQAQASLLARLELMARENAGLRELLLVPQDGA